MATAMINALSTATPSTSTLSSTKFLARQVQGKDLPHFHGNPEEWPAFISSYESSTKMCKYSDAENLPRLQRCLKGEASKLVQCTLVTPDSVPVVMKKLQEFYGKPERIIQAMTHKAREIPPVKADRPDALMEFGIVVDNLTSTIKTLNKPSYLSNPTLLEELLKKLPHMLQFSWGEYKIEKAIEDPTLEDFTIWGNKKTAVARDLCPSFPKQEQSKTRNDRRGNNNRVNVATDESRKKDFPQDKKCLCCQKPGHRLQSCKVYGDKSVQTRFQIAREKRCCFGCLNVGHRFEDCRSKQTCGINSCKKAHHKLLHSDQPIPKSTEMKKENVNQSKEESEPEETVKLVGNVFTAKGSAVINHLLVPVILKGPNGKEETFAVLDNYASLTTIEEDTATRLGLHGELKSLRVKGFNSTGVYKNSKVVQVKIKSKDGQYGDTLDNVRTVKELDLPRQSLMQSDLKSYPYLQGLGLETYQNVQPVLLIGMDNAHLFIQHDHRLGRRNEPIAIKTPFGWTVMGKMDDYSKQDFAFPIREEKNEEDEALHKLVKYYFTTESFGIKPSMGKPRSREDVRAQQTLDATMRRVKDGWETGLLWKFEEFEFPESKSNALRRLQSMERKMDRDPDFAKQYCERIAEYEEKKFARLLSPQEAKIETPRTFYLPHFMAYNPKKAKKLRFVFDAAAKSRGRSLNDFLLQGPDKMASLPAVLLQFRQRAVGITGDVKDMFHRVKVRKEDASSQRFLWRGMNRKQDPDVYEMGVLIFGAACSSCCAQEAKNKNALEYQEEFPDAYQSIVNRQYVDDLLDTRDSDEEAIKLVQDLIEVQRRGGFQLCNWLSNSRKVMESIPEELRAKQFKNLDVDCEVETERILGLFWRPDLDEFTFSLTYLKAKEEVLKGARIPTKRELVSLVMSVYDPLGFLAILSVKAKILIQKAWRMEIGWDEPIPATTHEMWKMWLDELQLIASFRLARCYSLKFSSAEDVQLHIFCDASEEAFGSVAYFRIKKQDEIEISLVMAKTKVSPLKAISIPRLELQAATMGARLAKFIEPNTEILITKTVIWSDSQTALSWIRSDSRRFHQFVSTRVGEIQEISEINQWRWIPTAENVADELTRSNKPCDWSPNSRWINGPQFLLQDEEAWPKQVNIPRAEDATEVKKQFIFGFQETEMSIIDVSRFSNFLRLIRTTAYVMKWMKKFKKLPHSPKDLISVEEFAEADKWWWRQSQEDSFPEELYALRNNKPIPKLSKLKNLKLFLDDNSIMRVNGRLDNAEAVPQSTKQPAVLDSKHPYIKLLISHFHQKMGHHGLEQIANEMRQLFWILGLKTAVRRAKALCQKCKNAKAKPSVPEMGQLPKFRLQDNVIPFHNTGLDYFGPIEVVVKRSRAKRYVALFTCLSTRAIHLEVANSLSTDSCIMAIRRFVSRRGSPVNIHSDNGTNFHGTNNELKQCLEELNQTKMADECALKGISWHFNPPLAPHMGESWERMVRAVKTAMGDVLQVKALTDETLHTVICEAEHTVNCHPLTHVSDDPSDPEALTPNHFLIGRSSNIQPIGKFAKDDLFDRKQWRISQEMANQFWRRWVREYLPTLLRRDKWNQQTKSIKLGDVVIEVNENLERNSWPKGVVTCLYPGKDDKIRVVDVRRANGKVYRRSVSRLCILDVQTQNQDKKQDSSVE